LALKARQSFSTTPIVEDGQVYAGCTDGNFSAFGMSTGAIRCQFDADDRFRASPALFENLFSIARYGQDLFTLNATGIAHDHDGRADCTCRSSIHSSSGKSAPPYGIELLQVRRRF